LISISFFNSERVKATDESVQKEIDINTEVFGIVYSEIVKVKLPKEEENKIIFL
jgi:hypothetical protein